MPDLFTSFAKSVNTVSAPRSSAPIGSSLFGGNTSEPVSVKESSGSSFFGLTNIFKREKTVTAKQTGNNQLTLSIKDYTGAGAVDSIRGHVPEQSVKVTQVGSQIITEATSNASDGAWNQILGVTERKVEF